MTDEFFDRDIHRKLDRILEQGERNERKLIQMTQALDDMKKSVSDLVTEVDNTGNTITTLLADLQEAHDNGDDEEFESLSQQIEQQVAALHTANSSAATAVGVTAPTPTPGAATGITVDSSNMATGTVGQAYTGALSISGGTAPYSVTISTTQPVNGLMMDGSGNITGTPAEAGSDTFAYEVTDSASPPNTSSGNAVVTVNAAAAGS